MKQLIIYAQPTHAAMVLACDFENKTVEEIANPWYSELIPTINGILESENGGLYSGITISGHKEFGLKIEDMLKEFLKRNIKVEYKEEL